jgi:hypothetical protein
VQVSGLIERFIEDERDFTSEAGGSRISDAAFVSTVKNVAHVLRSNGHSVPYLRIMKDVTLEAFCGDDMAVWEANAGPGPQLFRHLQSLLDPELGCDGDLTEEEIARHLGSSVDFWRVVTGTPDYWRHCKWMERLIVPIKPIVLSTWSNGVLAAVALGSLSLVSSAIPSSVRDIIDKGMTPFDIDQHLPPPHDNKSWYPKLEDETYLNSIGSLFIAQYGPDASHVTLLIPNLHSGVAKYRSREAHLVESIILSVGAIERVALGHVQLLHEAGVDPDWNNEVNLRAYFSQLKEDVERDIVARGLRSYLDNAKKQYRSRTQMSRHLERQSRPTRSSAASASAPYVIPGITHTSARGAARVAQLEKITLHVSSLVEAGFPEAAFRIVPYHLREAIHTEAFRSWFLSLLPDIRISCSSRIWGNSEEAYLATVANHTKFAANKAAHSAGGKATAEKTRAAKAITDHPSNKLRLALTQGSDLIKVPPSGRKERPLGSLPSHSGWRFAFCLMCSDLMLTKDNDTTHKCADGLVLPVRDKHIPSLRRLLYPHDILGNPDLTSLVPKYDDLLTEVHIPGIFTRPGNLAKAKMLFPDTDFTGLLGSIHVSPCSIDPIADNDLHLAMALDIAVVTMGLSRCPRHLWPTSATHRSKAWVGNTDWLDGSRAFYLLILNSY